jgi:exopolysaccharide biosynthesis polyprenyl glycosylphosphotransferase
MNSLFYRLAPGRSTRINLCVDLFLVVVSLVAADRLSGRESGTPLIGLAGGACVTWLVTGTALRHYNPWPRRQPMDDVAMICVLVLAVATTLAFAGTLGLSAAVPQVGWFLMVCTPAIGVLRLLVFRLLSSREGPFDEVLVLGIGALGRATGEYVEKHPTRRRVLGYLSLPDEDPVRCRPIGRYLGMIDRLAKCLAKYPVAEVYVAGNPVRHGDAMQAAIHTCEQAGVSFALPAYTFRLERSQPAARGSIPDGYVHYQSVTSKPYQMALKRLIDIVASGAALWILSPFFLLVAVLIKVTSPGPVIFRQVRVGLYGKRFNFLKFRSMVADADKLRANLADRNEQTGPVFKIRNDPRITPLGRFLRKYSIDELPQLVNVLRGDMSLVGPRPPLPSEVALYEPWQRRRLSVRPGLTCFWQVSGRNEISFETWMYLDMRYIDHWSLRKDLALILKTVPVVVTGRGAS